MAYVIKRYANRKLYDTQSKRYLTLDEVAILVRAGEEVQVVDADTGGDLTGQVLSRVIAEGSRREGGLVPQNLLVEWIQRPGEAVVGAVRNSVSVGQRTFEQFGGELTKLVGSVVGREGKPSESARKAAEAVGRAIEDRLRSLVAELNLATKSDIETLSRRLDALEAAASRPERSRSAAKARPAPARTRKRSTTSTAATGGEADAKKKD
jgi:polyhydroxyalkanoate synthesis repressor PhaR